MIGETISHYRVIEKIGEGGMGVVYLAEHTLLGRRVAIKTLKVSGAENRHFHSRFLREAQAVSKLSHPNIANIYDYGETDDGQPYIVMELVEGKTLDALLREEALTIARAMDIVKQVAGALSEAHRHGIVHRDIKPSNIAIDERGVVKVLDFGLAKHVVRPTAVSLETAHPSAMHTQTREGIIVGTPLYLSPEQALGVEVDARSDLFSLGSVLYECIAGRPPFAGKSAIDICAKVIRDDPPPPSEFNSHIPKDLDLVVRKVLAKKPGDRYQTCEEFFADIDAVEAAIGKANQTTRKTKTRFERLRKYMSGQTISALFRPRPSLALYLIGGMVAASLVGFWLTQRTNVHEPLPEALRLYEQGVEALHDGSYYKANHLFDQAAQADDRFPLTFARQAQVWAELDDDGKAKETIARANALALNDSSRMTELDNLYLQAISDVVLRNLADATVKFEKIAHQVPTVKRTSAYMDLSDVYEKNEQLAKAIETYSMIESAGPNPSASMKLAVLYGRQQKLNDASAQFANAESLYRSVNNQEGITAVFIQRGALFDNLDRSSPAYDELRNALNLSRQTGNKPQQVRALLQLGSVLNTQRKPDLAEQYISDAIDMARAEGMEELATKGLIDLGNVFFANGRYDQAEDYFKRAIENSAKHKGVRSSARATLSLGSVRLQQGKTDSAVGYIQQALTFYQQGGYVKETSQALLLLGRVNDYRGDYDAAQNAFANQLQIAKQTGDQSQEARAQMELGSSLYHGEKYVEAVDHFRECERLDRLLGNDSQLGYDLLYRGIVAQELGLSKDARAYYQEANKVARSNNQLQAWLHLYNARFALSDEDYRTAIRESENALDLAGSQFRDIAVQSKYVLGLSQAYSGTPGAGASSCKQAVESAVLTGDPRLISYARLAYAEVLVKTGFAQEALTNAQQAESTFSQRGQRDSQWRALAIKTQATVLTGNSAEAKTYASKALELISGLEQSWGKDIAASYFARQDVKRSREYLNKILAAT